MTSTTSALVYLVKVERPGKRGLTFARVRSPSEARLLACRLARLGLAVRVVSAEARS